MVCPLFIIFVLVLQDRAAGNAIAAAAVLMQCTVKSQTNGSLSRPFTCDEVLMRERKTVPSLTAGYNTSVWSLMCTYTMDIIPSAVVVLAMQWLGVRTKNHA